MPSHPGGGEIPGWLGDIGTNQKSREANTHKDCREIKSGLKKKGGGGWIRRPSPDSRRDQSFSSWQTWSKLCCTTSSQFIINVGPARNNHWQFLFLFLDFLDMWPVPRICYQSIMPNRHWWKSSGSAFETDVIFVFAFIESTWLVAVQWNKISTRETNRGRRRKYRVRFVICVCREERVFVGWIPSLAIITDAVTRIGDKLMQ